MKFGQALEVLFAGGTVARAGWNGKDMFIALQRPDANSKMTLPYLYMKTADGNLVPWLISQTDALSDDWGVVVPAVLHSATIGFGARRKDDLVQQPEFKAQNPIGLLLGGGLSGQANQRKLVAVVEVIHPSGIGFVWRGRYDDGHIAEISRAEYDRFRFVERQGDLVNMNTASEAKQRAR